jgi:hypothetical protein
MATMAPLLLAIAIGCCTYQKEREKKGGEKKGKKKGKRK